MILIQKMFDIVFLKKHKAEDYTSMNSVYIFQGLAKFRRYEK